jgi:biopolymer transport protein ExbD
MLIIHADANARHQGVISAMEAARKAGLTQVTFATVSPVPGSTP